MKKWKICVAGFVAVMCVLFACGCAGEDKTVTVMFRAEGAEDIVLTTKYGGSVDAPEVPEKIGNEGRWDTDTLQNLTQDTVVTAVYETQGLTFTLGKDINGENYYIVGNEEDSYGERKVDLRIRELYLPSYHDGIPVKEIGSRVFLGIPCSNGFSFQMCLKRSGKKHFQNVFGSKRSNFRIV